MTTHIHTTSHPLLRAWTSYVCNKQLSITETQQIIKKIMRTMLYEISRKALKSAEIYVKETHNVSNISIIINKPIHIVIPDIYLSHTVADYALEIIPQGRIHPIYIKEDNNRSVIQEYNSQCANFFKNSKIIILTQYLKKNTIIRTIESLEENNISINQIQICCIICSHEVIEEISTIYKNLDIYTVKIINNQSDISLVSFWKRNYYSKVNSLTIL